MTRFVQHLAIRLLASRSDDSGSFVVELVIISPIVVIFALLSLAFGRISEAHQQVVEAARAGAQAAAVMPSASQASWAASANAVIGPIGTKHLCTHGTVITDTQSFRPGGSVTVTVTCQIDLADVVVPGIPGSTTATATVTAAVDPYRSVG